VWELIEESKMGRKGKELLKVIGKPSN